MKYFPFNFYVAVNVVVTLFSEGVGVTGLELLDLVDGGGGGGGGAGGDICWLLLTVWSRRLLILLLLKELLLNREKCSKFMRLKK